MDPRDNELHHIVRLQIMSRVKKLRDYILLSKSKQVKKKELGSLLCSGTKHLL